MSATDDGRYEENKSTSTNFKTTEEEEEEEEEEDQPLSPVSRMLEDAQDAAYVVKKDVEELASSAADFFTKLQFNLFDTETRLESPARVQRTSSRQHINDEDEDSSIDIVDPFSEVSAAAKSVTDEITNAFSQVTSSIKEEFFALSDSRGGDLADPSSSLLSTEIDVLFPELPADVVLVDAVSCYLMQEYTCKSNNLTPDVGMSFAGALFLCDSHICFALSATTSQSSNAGAKIVAKYSDIESCKEIKEVSTASELIFKFKRGVLNSDSTATVVFGRFHSETGLNDALSIIELKSEEGTNS